MYWVKIIVLIQIIKRLPPYCDNKPLPTPTRYFYWLFPSFLLKINAFLMRYEIWKGNKKVVQKVSTA